MGTFWFAKSSMAGIHHAVRAVVAPEVAAEFGSFSTETAIQYEAISLDEQRQYGNAQKSRTTPPNSDPRKHVSSVTGTNTVHS